MKAALTNNKAISLGRLLGDHFVTWLPAYLLVGMVAFWLGQHYKLVFNVSESLSGHAYLVIKGELPTHHDEPVAFRWNDPQQQTQYPDGVTFLKLAGGMPGDIVSREGKQIVVNQWKLTPKSFSSYGKQLLPNQFTGAIPFGHYFAVGEHTGSLDSRYALVGLVSQTDIIGRAYELF